jgi:hypothetical protein
MHLQELVKRNSIRVSWASPIEVNKISIEGMRRAKYVFLYLSLPFFPSLPLLPFSFPFFSPFPFYPSPFTSPLPLSLKTWLALQVGKLVVLKYYFTFKNLF